MVRVRQIGLCNIVAQKPLAKEFIQYAVTADNIAQETIRLITDQPYRSQILTGLADLRLKMTNNHASRQVAHIAMKLIS